MNPEFKRNEAAMQQRLANQGLPQASRAYTAETARFDRTRNRAMEEAAMSAVLAGGGEQSRMLADLLAPHTGIGQAAANRSSASARRWAPRDSSSTRRWPAVSSSSVKNSRASRPTPAPSSPRVVSKAPRRR